METLNTHYKTIKDYFYSLLRVDGARIALTPNLRCEGSVCGVPGLGRRGGRALRGAHRSALDSARGDAPMQPALRMSQDVLLDRVRCK